MSSYTIPIWQKYFYIVRIIELSSSIIYYENGFLSTLIFELIQAIIYDSSWNYLFSDVPSSKFKQSVIFVRTEKAVKNVRFQRMTCHFLGIAGIFKELSINVWNSEVKELISTCP